MINLAGHENPNPIVERELVRARIEIVRGEIQNGEVKTSITGRVGKFIFARAWRYWVANGPMPLDIADEIYADPIGKEDARAGGDAAMRPPITWATWRDTNGKQRFPMKDMATVLTFEEPTRSRVLADIARDWHVSETTDGFTPWVETYHIDSEAGLRLFADTVKKIGEDR